MKEKFKLEKDFFECNNSGNIFKWFVKKMLKNRFINLHINH